MISTLRKSRLVLWLATVTGSTAVAGSALVGLAVIVDGLELLAVPGLALLLLVSACVASRADSEIRRLQGRTDDISASLDAEIAQLNSEVASIKAGLSDIGDDVQQRVSVEDSLIRRVRGLEERVTATTQVAARREKTLEDSIDELSDQAPRIINRIRDLEVRHTGDQRHLEQALRDERSDRSAMIAHLADDGQPPRRVLLLMTIHRSGSTRLFDLLRTHPAIQVVPTARVWADLGMTGRRYPAALSDIAGAWSPMEVAAGVGAGVTPAARFEGPTVALGDRWALEKAHPQFIDFSASKLIDEVGRLRDSGVDVKLVYGIREPLAAMWSMVEYKQRDPSWYEILDVADIPDWIERSLSVIEELDADLGGRVIDFDELEDGTSFQDLARDLVPDWSDAETHSWIAFARDQLGPMTARRKTGSDFIGERDPDRLPAGPQGSWESCAETIQNARAIHARLRTPATS